MEEWRRILSPHFDGESGVVYYFNSEVVTKDKLGHEQYKYFSKPFTLNPKYGKTLEKNLKKMNTVPKDVLKGLLNKRQAMHFDNLGNRWIIWISDTAIPKSVLDSNVKKVDKMTGREVSAGGIIL